MAHNTTGEIDSILWVDCEFTGLDPETDKLLQVAAIVTTPAFEETGEYNSFVYHPLDVIQPLISRNDWWVSHQDQYRSVVASVENQGKPVDTVDNEFALFIEQSCDPSAQNMVYAGNSPRKDRTFLEKYLPNAEKQIGYRTIDVSSLKILAKHALGIEYPKQYRHDALDDIRESIAEAQFLIGAMCKSSVRRGFGLR